MYNYNNNNNACIDSSFGFTPPHFSLTVTLSQRSGWRLLLPGPRDQQLRSPPPLLFWHATIIHSVTISLLVPRAMVLGRPSSADVAGQGSLATRLMPFSSLPP
ncbi:hypothetical protein LIA77_02018 [Sarocladium implicatum]|nr:hypothetical protein LIA77_02018 [Sarocladium implicatum]